MTQSVIVRHNHGAVTGNVMGEAGSMQPEKEGRVSEAIILVGDIPCPMTRPIRDPAKARIEERSAQHKEPEGRRVRLMPHAG
jgi:hypothetical protein